MIEYLEWDEGLRTGEQVADREHQEFIYLVNTFLNGLAAGKADKILDTFLAHLIEFAQEHFRKEEALLRGRIEPPSFVRYRDDQRNRVSELKMLKNGYARAKLGVNDVVPFFKDWVYDHVGKFEAARSGRAPGLE